mmetsp:Transcript_5321/g.5444  ORF Transcript_5321/g.5444 Transcript_5321/m.5444 type:complete len:243 (+) Transcript_5321:11-739(+)
MSYDKSLSIFSPSGTVSQVDYAYEAAKKGGLSVGLVGKDYVIIAAEKKSVPKLQDSRTVKKISKVDSHIFMSFAGIIADSRYLVDYARLECQSYRYNLDSVPTIDYLVKQIAFKQQDFTQRTSVRPFGLSVLVGGFDKNNNPTLYSSEPSGFSSQWKAIAVGKNAEKVNEFLESKYQDDIEYEQGLSMVLESMLEYVESGSKNVEIAVMYKDKEMETIADEEIDRRSETIEQEKKKREKEKK